MLRRAAKYRRISSDPEGRELGVTRQDEDLDDLAARRGLTIVADYCDNDIGASTRSTKPRPDYKQMLADAREGKFEVIAAYTTGRLTRRPREHEDLIDLAEKYGIRFEYVRSPSFDLTTAQGRRIARTLAAQDAGESEEIAERVTRAARQRAEKGLNHGGRRCFGYEPDGMRLIPEEAAEVAKIFTDFLAGETLGSIVRDLHDRGVETVTGSAWGNSTIRDLLKRPRYAGLSEYRGEIVGEGRWPAIVTPEVFYAAKSLVTDPKRRTSTGNRAAYLLSGIAVCAVCGGPITSAGIGGGNTRRHLYRCRANYCTAVMRDWADQYVTGVIVDRLSRPDAGELLVDHQAPDFDALAGEERALREILDGAAADYAEQRIDRSQMLIITDRTRGKLARVVAAQQHTSRAPVLRELVEADDVRAAWEGMGLDRRRAVVKMLMSVQIARGGSGRHGFDPSKVMIDWRV
jgi:site-specific DNA recombinase